MTTKKTIEQVVNEAFEAATKATTEYLSAGNPWFPCGFAWVVIKPANIKLAKYLKVNHDCRLAYGGGLMVYNPSRNATQSLDAKLAGAVAFVEVIKAELGDINIYTESRWD
jgi:hypothetical protein